MSKTEGQFKKKQPSYIHVKPCREALSVNHMTMRKVKLGDGQERTAPADLLPVLRDSDDSQEERKDQPGGGDQERSAIQSMNQRQVSEHIQKCLEMSSENKITPKNAFALQLIDCMNILMEEKKDFSTMACTLDAGAKIYSNRVDALHQQVVKLADEVILHQRRKKAGEKEDAREDGAECTDDKDKRKVKKKNILVSKESLVRKMKERDPKDRFLKIEAMPGAALSSVRRDPKSLAFSLENNLQFWQNWDEYKPLKAEGTVTLPHYEIHRTPKKENLETYMNIESKKEIPPETDENSNIVAENNKDPSPEELPCDNCVDDINDDHCSEEEVVDIADNDDESSEEVPIIATAMKRLNEEAANDGVHKPVSRFEALKILFADASEYDYLNKKNAHYWAGPEFWKRPTSAGCNLVDAKKKPRKKKEPVTITYSCDRDSSVNGKMGKLSKKRNNLARQTVRNWKKNRLALPRDLKIEINVFLDLFHIYKISQIANDDSHDSSLFENEISHVDKNIEMIGENYSQESLNSQGTLNNCFYDGIPESSGGSEADTLNSAFYDIGLARKTQLSQEEPQSTTQQSKAIKVQIASSNTLDDSLVPAPKRIVIEPIKYSTRPIRVDMQHLKATMLRVIHEQVEKDAQQKMSYGMGDTTPETVFNSILKELPSKLEKRTAQDLSSSMAFLALLTLANENNLQLINTEDSDVAIRLEERSDIPRTSNSVPSELYDSQKFKHSDSS